MGFRRRHLAAAQRVAVGDKMLCYLTDVSRWFGVLRVVSSAFIDDAAIFLPEEDPFVVRFRVEPLVLLDVVQALPIHEDEIWSTLSFTRDHNPQSSTWTGKLRTSLVSIDEQDGQFLEQLLLKQLVSGKTYDYDVERYAKSTGLVIRRADRDVSVTVPDELESTQDEPVEREAARESHRIQALIADIGARMGMSIWIPRVDRGAVERERRYRSNDVLDRLPLNYDDATLGTIENIDVLWLKGRAIARAFEVEHTTAIYSGVLRMADLLALQPNMDIRLHIVAPLSRRAKVFTEIKRPVFSLLERGPLAESCTYLSYERLRELAGLRHLEHMGDSVLDEYAEEVE